MGDSAGGREDRSTGLRLAEDLEALVQKALNDLSGEFNADRHISLNLGFTFNRHTRKIENFSPQRDIKQALISQLSSQTVNEGRLYCFKCLSDDCRHSLAGSLKEVFTGYSATGVPQFSDFHQALINAGRDDIDLLFDEKPAYLTMFSSGRELHRQQLNAFGGSSSFYRIMGQLSAGYFLHRNERFALDIRVIRFIDRGRKKYRLDTGSGIRIHPRFREILQSQQFSFVARAVSNAATEIEQIHLQPDRLHKQAVGRILQQLKNEIDRNYRRKNRRTRHARERAEENRPVSEARADIRKATPESVFRDNRTNSIIVNGGRNRVHVLSEKGSHVTSLFLNRSEIEKRIRKKRWLPLPCHEAAEMLNLLNRE